MSTPPKLTGYLALHKHGTGVCDRCGKVDLRTRYGGMAYCWDCIDDGDMVKCQLCGHGQRAPSRASVCTTCIRWLRSYVVDGKMRPLDEGEIPRCVYPDCFHCPLDDCRIDNSTLTTLGLTVLGEYIDICIRCGNRCKSATSYLCQKCRMNAIRAQQERLDYIFGDSEREENRL